VAKEAGISVIILKRAKKEMEVKSYPEYDEHGEKDWVCQMQGEKKERSLQEIANDAKKSLEAISKKMK
jgi:hypothetical protein